MKKRLEEALHEVCVMKGFFFFTNKSKQAVKLASRRDIETFSYFVV